MLEACVEKKSPTKVRYCFKVSDIAHACTVTWQRHGKCWYILKCLYCILCYYNIAGLFEKENLTYHSYNMNNKPNFYGAFQYQRCFTKRKNIDAKIANREIKWKNVKEQHTLMQ